MDHSHYLAILIVCVIIVTIIIVRASASRMVAQKETFDARANLCSRTDADSSNTDCWKSGLTADDVAHDRCLKNPFCGPYSVSGTYAPAMGAYPIDIPVGIHMTGSLPDHAPPE